MVVLDYCLKIGRTVASFISAVLLAFVGDVTGRVFNLMIGYPWPQEVHLNIQLVMIGLGAGVGAYLGWLNLSMSKSWSLSALALIVVAGVAGVFLGKAFGPGVDPTYWWSRFAIDISIHLGAAASGTAAATLIRLVYHVILNRRNDLKPRKLAMTTTASPNSGGHE